MRYDYLVIKRGCGYRCSSTTGTVGLGKKEKPPVFLELDLDNTCMSPKIGQKMGLRIFSHPLAKVKE